MLLFIVPLAAWLYNQAADIATGVGDFVRSIPSFFAPKPSGLSGSYTPPFTGGQCVGVQYYVGIALAYNGNPVDYTFADWNRDAQGNISGNAPLVTGKILEVFATNTGWAIRTDTSFRNNIANGFFVPITGIKIVRADGQPDTCGDVGNPNPPPSISDDGLFKPNNTYITDSNDVVNPAAIVLAPALPLVLVPLISSAISAALAAARAATDALEAVKKIAEALEGLAELWKKLKEFLDEWEKNRPKKRDITRQTYGQIEGDGALDFFAPNSKKVEAIQLDIIVTNIPIGFGRYFGSMSPSRYRYRELGYIAFYSVNQGILETHSLQFKRSTLQIPKLAVGFIYHFGLDNQIKAFAFGTFSIEKS